MPPHCDSMDGPVVKAAALALDEADVDLVLPYVPLDGEAEVCAAFDLAVKAREQGPEAKAVADQWFFETVVRVHREGEGAAFTGLKPAGLDVGPAIPLAEQAIKEDSTTQLARFLAEEVAVHAMARLERVRAAAAARDGSVEAARLHVREGLGLQVWAHHVHLAVVDHVGHG